MTDSVIQTEDLWRYSVLAVPIAFAGFPLYVLAPDYYATKYGVSLSLLGFLLLVLRLFDAIQDPLIGTLSDRYRYASIWFMRMTSIILCVAIYGLFNVMPANPAIWFSLCIAIAVSAYSVLSINLNALGGLWTKDRNAQTRITALRESCGLIGLVIAVSLPSLLKKYLPQEQAYLYFCVILSVLMAGAWIAFRPWLTKNVSYDSRPDKPSGSLFAGIKSTPRITCYLLSIYGLSTLASSVPAVLVIFFVRDLLNAEYLTGFFLLLYFLSGAAAMPLWKSLSARFDKYRAWVFAMLIAIASFVWAFFLHAGDTWQYGAICMFSGVALGADLALPSAILADHIHKSQTEEHATTQYSLLVLVAKLALALASAIVLPLLAKAGFIPAASNNASALLFLSASYALIPCVLKLSATLLLWYLFIYPKQGDSHENAHINRPIWSSHHA